MANVQLRLKSERDFQKDHYYYYYYYYYFLTLSVRLWSAIIPLTCGKTGRVISGGISGLKKKNKKQKNLQDIWWIIWFIFSSPFVVLLYPYCAQWGGEMKPKDRKQTTLVPFEFLGRANLQMWAWRESCFLGLLFKSRYEHIVIFWTFMKMLTSRKASFVSLRNSIHTEVRIEYKIFVWEKWTASSLSFLELSGRQRSRKVHSWTNPIAFLVAKGMLKMIFSFSPHCSI